MIEMPCTAEKASARRARSRAGEHRLLSYEPRHGVDADPPLRRAAEVAEPFFLEEVVRFAFPSSSSPL
jgi:hypothetical protein